MTEKERWLPVVNYEGHYEVSDKGRVRSLDRRGGNSRVYRGKLLSPAIEKRSGYKALQLYKNNQGRPARVHNLVLEAHIGLRPEGAVARHLDGDPTNNQKDNLCWGSKLDNALDAQIHGSWTHADSHGQAKLSSEQAEIIYRLKGEFSSGFLAKAFNVSVSSVTDIWAGRTWLNRRSGQ